ncbi:MAG: DUF4417 domain-containing protein [Bacillota bacterium]
MIEQQLFSHCGRECTPCHFYLKDLCYGCNNGCSAPGICRNNCTKCGYLCRNRPGVHNVLNAIGGPGFPALNKPPTPWPGDTPDLLPAVAARFSTEPTPGSLPWVAINAARMVISRNFKTGGLRRKNGSIREFARIHLDTSMVMHMYIPDPPLEAFWRTRREIYPSLREFDLVIAPNFSLYEDSPRFEHLINIKRSALVYSEMLHLGIRAIPDVSWATYKDLNRWAKYINTYNIPVISTSIQTVRQNAGNYWRVYLKGIQHLSSKLSLETVIIIVGAGSVEKMKAIKSRIPQRVVFLTTQPFLLSRKGRLIDRQKALGDKDYDAWFFENIRLLRENLKVE